MTSRGNAETVVTTGGTTATWTKAGSPYLVMARVTFEDLTIEAGTVVRGAIGESSRITVSHAFVVTGTRAEPAVFEASGAGSLTATWEGIWPATFDVTGAIFRHANPAIFGGTTSATSRVSDSVFEENNWAIDLRGHLEVDAVAFAGNNTAIFGDTAAGVYDVKVTNATLVGGQGIVALQPANISVKSSTFSSVMNPVVSERPATISNCILANVQFTNPGQGAVSVAHSSVWPLALPSTVVAGDGVVREDPQLVSATNLRLRATSPCIDSATADGAPERDIDGNVRPIGLGFDRGAHEFSPDDDGGEGGAGGAASDAGAGGESGGGAGPTSGGTAGNSAGGAAGAAGMGASAASGPTMGGSGSGGDTTLGGANDSGGAREGSKSSSACGCRMPGSERSQGERAALVGVLAGLLLVGRRRRT